MSKKLKKESLSDLKEELEGKADEVAEVLEEKAEDIAEEVIETVDEVKKSKNISSFFSRIPKQRFAVLFLVMVAIGGVGASGYFYFQYSQTQKVLGNSDGDFSNAQFVVEKVGRLIELPTEQPTVATVSDIEKLKSQPLFKNAQNGDKVLIYQTAKKALLYRPSTNKLVDVANVNLNQEGQPQAEDQALPSQTPTEEEIVKTVILNGTTTTGLTLRGAEALEGIENIEITQRDNAQSRDYEENIVVNIGNVSAEKVKEIADALDARVESLPEEENSFDDADIVVILGSDFASETPSEE